VKCSGFSCDTDSVGDVAAVDTVAGCDDDALAPAGGLHTLHTIVCDACAKVQNDDEGNSVMDVQRCDCWKWLNSSSDMDTRCTSAGRDTGLQTHR
jgi:hypothetical protein